MKSVEEHARIVIGADGVSSLVARAVRAPEYDSQPVAACAYYSYFSGVQQDDIELCYGSTSPLNSRHSPAHVFARVL